MKKEQCRWCSKVVRHKPLFGTLHLCVDAHRRRQIDDFLWRAEMQQRDVEMRSRGLGRNGYGLAEMMRPGHGWIMGRDRRPFL